jgi:hypothetical protein
MLDKSDINHPICEEAVVEGADTSRIGVGVAEEDF